MIPIPIPTTSESNLGTRVESHRVSPVMAIGVGMLAGGVAALLWAPASGRDMRKKIVDTTRQSANRVKLTAINARELIRDQRVRIGAALKASRDHYRDRNADQLRTRVA